MRLGIGSEALAKLLTCYNIDMNLNSNTDIVTEKKIRSQKKILFEEACDKKRKLHVKGTNILIFLRNLIPIYVYK